MLTLFINNKDHLELSPKDTISVTLVNPAFDDQGIARNYSYPKQVALTPANSVALNQQHRLDTRSRSNELPADILIYDQLFDKGRATVDEHTNTTSRLTFQNEDMKQISALSDINIRDLLTTIDIPQTEEAFFTFTPQDGALWRFTIDGTLYTAGGLGVDVDDAMADLVIDINTDYPGLSAYNSTTNELIFTPGEEDIVLDAGVDFDLVAEQTVSDAREINLQAYITAATAGTEPVAFPVVYAPDFYPRNFRWRFYINNRIDNTYLNNEYGSEFGWATTYVPFVRLRYIFDLIANEAGLAGIVFDLPTVQAEDMDSLLIYNNVTLDNLRLERSFEFGELEKNGFKKSITLADHVPDVTAQQLIQRIADYANLNLRFERGTLYLRPNIRQIAQPAKDWTSITDPQWKRTTSEGGGVVISFEEDTDTPWPPTHDNYTIGDGTNELVLPARPLHDRTLPLSQVDNEYWKVAAIEGQTGTSEPLGIETENQTLRLFFDKGQQDNETGKPYWMGSVGTTDYDDNPIGEISLDLGSSTGIYNTFWRGWTQLLFSPTITRITALNIEQLIELKKWINAKVHIYHPDGSTLAVVERVQFKASTKGITVSKVEYRKFET